MKTIISAALISLAAGSAAFASVQPIPGSITYDNANVQLEKAPGRLDLLPHLCQW